MRGATRLFESAAAPLLVFEAHPDHMRAAGTDYDEVRAFLAEHGGYEIFALGRSGLRPEPRDARLPSTTDVLAARRIGLRARFQIGWIQRDLDLFLQLPE